MADRLSAIFALFAVTWKITLKTAPNKGSKNGTQNHFSESSMTYFDISFAFPQKAGMNGLLPGPGINTKWPSCTLQIVTLSVNPT